jgi:hypothetical protein
LKYLIATVLLRFNKTRRIFLKMFIESACFSITYFNIYTVYFLIDSYSIIATIYFNNKKNILKEKFWANKLKKEFSYFYIKNESVIVSWNVNLFYRLLTLYFLKVKVFYINVKITPHLYNVLALLFVCWIMDTNKKEFSLKQIFMIQR